MSGLPSTLGILWALSPFGCDEEAARPQGSAAPFAKSDAGAAPVDENSCDRYECRSGMECQRKFCRTEDGASEKMCKTISFWEIAKNFYVGVPSRVCDGPCEEDANVNLSTCVLSDTVDFANLEGRSLTWGVYRGDSAVDLLLDKAATIDQRGGESAQSLPGSQLYRTGVCGAGAGMDGAGAGIFFGAADIPEGKSLPWVRFSVSIDPEVERREATFFLLEGKFFPTAEGENSAAPRRKILGLKIDDNQGGPVKMGDWLGDPREFRPSPSISTPLTPDCAFQEIGSYHALLSNHPLSELRVYIQPWETVGLSGLHVWSCTCDTPFLGSIFVPKEQ